MTPVVARKYRFNWTRLALTDVAGIASCAGAMSLERAMELRRKLAEAAATLATHPMRGRVVPELHDFGIDLYREIVVEHYRIMYRVEGKRVIVALVIDGRRDVDHILLERLIGI